MSTPHDDASVEAALDDIGIDAEVSGEVWESAGADFPDQARRALSALLRARFITRARQRGTWDTLLAYEDEIRQRLADLYLELEIDRDMFVAFKRQSRDEDAPRVLRKDQRPLSRDASFLLIFLRKECIYTDGQDEPVVVTRTQIEEFLRTYREDDDGDEARFEGRVRASVNQLSELGLLEADREADYLFTVSPVVVPLVGVDELIRLETAFRAGGASQPVSQPAAGNSQEEA